MNFSEEFRDSRVRFSIHIPFSNSSWPVEYEILYLGLLWLCPLMLRLTDIFMAGRAVSSPAQGRVHVHLRHTLEYYISFRAVLNSVLRLTLLKSPLTHRSPMVSHLSHVQWLPALIPLREFIPIAGSENGRSRSCLCQVAHLPSRHATLHLKSVMFPGY